MAGETTGAFFATLCFNAGIGLAFLVLFGFLRALQPDLYFKYRPKEFLPRNPFSWMCTVYRIDDNELRSKPDGLVLLWILRMLFRITAICAVVCVCVCVPVNILGDNGAHGLEMLTEGNIEDESYLFLIHACCVILCSLATVYYLLETAERFAGWREAYLQEKRASNYLVLFRGLGQLSPLPKGSDYEDSPETRARTHGKLARNALEFAKKVDGVLSRSAASGNTELTEVGLSERLNHVSAVTLFCDVKPVEKIVDDLDNVEERLEMARKNWDRTHKENPDAPDDQRPTHKVGGKCCCGACCGRERVDTISWCEDTRLPELRAELDELRADKLTPLNAACVTPECPLRRELDTLEIWRAPDEEDMYWRGMGKPLSRWRSFVATVLAVALSVWFSILVVFIASLANLESINQKCSCLGFVEDIPDSVLKVMETYIPVLITLLALWLVPGVLYTINSRVRYIACSHITHATMISYYKFLFFNLFIVFLLSGSVFDRLDDLLRDATSIASTLGEAIPTTSTFFIVYVMLKGIVGLPMRLTLIDDLIIGRIKLRFAKTDKQIETAIQAPPIDLSIEAPNLLVTFAITLTYATMAPIILPFSFFYYWFAYVVFKQQLLCCCDTGRAVPLWPDLESHGAGVMMRSMLHMTFFGLVIALVLNASYLSIRQSWPATALCLLPLPFVVWKWCKVCSMLSKESTAGFQPSSVEGSEPEVEIDPREFSHEPDTNDVDEDSAMCLYQNPSLRRHPGAEFWSYIEPAPQFVTVERPSTDECPSGCMCSKCVRDSQMTGKLINWV